jgi:hypothetical protein
MAPAGLGTGLSASEGTLEGVAVFVKKPYPVENY